MDSRKVDYVMDLSLSAILTRSGKGFSQHLSPHLAPMHFDSSFTGTEFLRYLLIQHPRRRRSARPPGRRQFSVARARLHCEHDWEYRASGVCNSARIGTVLHAVVSGTLGFSCRGDTRRTGHGPGQC